MKARTTIMAALSATVLAINAAPTQNTYHAVTNDWRSGMYSNVLELAQSRLAANTNDIVAAYIMKDYDIMRLIRAGALVTLPAYTNRFPRLRQGYEDFLEFVIPAHDDNFRIQEQHRPIPPGTPMNSEHLLQLFWENNLW